MRRSGWMAIVLGAALSVPVVGHAQSGVVYGGRTATDDVDAAVLESRAQSLFPVPKKYGEAAKLYLQAADLRVAGDPQRVADLMMASRLSYYNGRTSRAWEIMKRAAEEALATGDVINAAHAFVDASFLAKEAGAMTEVVALIERAQLLTASPLLDTNDRAAIRARIGDPGA
ncbi:MAG: hypothetical protein L0271_19260 [Gemmatimonadetes bacterium]|nr:hypothetical protein [Gemmatimonadota bacterium]